MLSFPDPAKLRTSRVIFENAFHARDSGTLEQLKELSSRRRLIGDSINGERFMTGAIAREMAGGLTSKFQQDLQKLEVYLPLLENLVAHIATLDESSKFKLLQSASDLQIRWSSALTEQSFFNFGGPKLHKIDNLQLELGLAIYLHGALLREQAFETMTEDIVASAALLRKASGVYKYLANELLPPMQTLLTNERPLEVVSSTSEIMSLICLAEAQAATIKKAEERYGYALLSKLHYGVTQMFDKAALILRTDARNLNEVSTRFQEFISLSSFLHQMRSQRCIAEALVTQHHAGDASGQLGAAIAILRLAIENSKCIKPPTDKSWRSTLDKEVADVVESLRKFEHVNEFVYREKLPSYDQLPALQAVQIVQATPYQPERWERLLDFET